MKRLLCFLLALTLLAFPLLASAQVTIKIEELSKPERLLPVWKVSCGENTLSKNVDADSLVLIYGNHPFFYGMYEAYASHRPFVLSPDMIWMLIAQGFSHHINSDPEKYRDKMVDFSGKMSLVVESEKPLESAEWDVLIPQFAEKIRENTKGTIAETMIADFSTTTQYEQIASEITLMETTKAYFEFVTMYVACGIPEVTLLGTTEDWQKVYDKAMQLRSYGLGWWIDELKPILKQFIDASKGKTDVKFWRNMFKWHTQKEYGAPNIIDGWIVKFFPYDKDGKRFDLKTLTRDSNLPDEISKADVRFIEIYEDGSKVETMIELYGGFIGLEQNHGNFALTLKIGWLVKKRGDEALLKSLKTKNREFDLGLHLRVQEFPEELKEVDSIPSLTLDFKKEVVVPEWIKDKKIGYLEINGTISDEERSKLLAWYPESNVAVNNVYYERKNGKANVRIKDNKIGSALDGIDSIGILTIENMRVRYWKNHEWTSALNVRIPETVTKNIGKIDLYCKPSRNCLNKLKKQFPNTKIHYTYTVSFGKTWQEVDLSDFDIQEMARKLKEAEQKKDNLDIEKSHKSNVL